MTTNEVTATGLTTKPLSEIISDLETAFKTIYGADINLDQNSPDGQMVGIFAQEIRDLLDLITQAYNSFDPDVAEGAALDARVALNGIERNGGTYTIAPVEVTVDRALTLYGLDSFPSTPFTVADAAGNQFYLELEQVIGAPGTNEYDFRAKDVGAVQVQQNTITSQITVIVGVTALNNPNPAGSIGEDEESDADLKLRRNVSLAVGAKNTLDTMSANLLNIETVTDAYVHENYLSVPDGYGVTAHTMWAIVEGGATADIGQVIYSKKSPGCNMKGTVTENVLRPNGEYFPAQFDRPSYDAIHIKFTLTPRQAGLTYDADDVKAALVAALDYKIFGKATSAEITDLLLIIVPDFIPTLVEVSTDDINWFEILSPTTPQQKFTIAVGNITIT